MKAVEETGVYFQCNMYVPKDLDAVPPDIRRAFNLRQQSVPQEDLWDLAASVQNPCDATLWLIGVEGHGTHFHVDWAEACNVAWRMSEHVCAIPSSTMSTTEI